MLAGGCEKAFAPLLAMWKSRPNSTPISNYKNWTAQKLYLHPNGHGTVKFGLDRYIPLRLGTGYDRFWRKADFPHKYPSVRRFLRWTSVAKEACMFGPVWPAFISGSGGLDTIPGLSQ